MAADRIGGPVHAEVLRIIDGDTIEVAAEPWLGVTVTALVRIRGIDAPELRGDCPSEKALAAAARDRLASLTGPLVVLTDIANDKYAGRIVADVRTRDDRDLRLAMLASGLARPYDGGGRGAWCP